MRARSALFVATTVALGAAGAGCTAILGLPDPTVDSTYGTDAYVPPPDGAPPDGALPDGAVPDVIADGGVDVTVSDAGCFGAGRSDAGTCNPVLLHTGAGDTTDPYLLDTDGTYVYVVASFGTIARLDPNVQDGGALVLTKNEPNVRAIDVVGGYVHFTANANSGMSNVVSRCPASVPCTPMNRLDYVGPTARKPWGIAVAGGIVYYTFAEGAGVGLGGLYGVPQGGGTPAQLLQFASPSLLEHEGGRLFWSSSSGQSDGVFSCPVGNCTMGGMAMGSDVVALAVDATRIYWIQGTSLGSIYRQDRTGQPNVTPVLTGVADPKAIRVDGSHIYWLKATALQRCQISGTCVPETLATFQQGGGLALDATSVYFTTRNDNKVWRVGK